MKASVSILGIAVAVLVGLWSACAQAKTVEWKGDNSKTAFSWSDPFWDPSQPEDGDDVIIKTEGLKDATVSISLYRCGEPSLRSLTYQQSVNQKCYVILHSGSLISLGEGGFTIVPAATPWSQTRYGWAPSFQMPLCLTASQTWTIDMPAAWGPYYMRMMSDISGGADVLWKICGRHEMRFSSGDSTGFAGTVLANSFLRLYGEDQVNRFGTAGLTLTTGEIDGVPGMPGLFFESDTGCNFVCETPLTLMATNAISIGHYNPCSVDLVAVDPAGNYSLRFTKPLAGEIGNKMFLFGGYCLHPYDTYDAVGVNSIYRSESQRIILDQDNSGLRHKAAGDQIYLSSLLNLGHANALGTDNGEFDLIMYGTGDPSYSKGRAGIVGVFASNGVSVAANLYTPSSSATGGRNDRFVVGTDGPGESVFSGELNTLGNKYYSAPGFRFMPDAGGTVRVTGKITDNGPLEVVGRGDVVLANAGNTLPNDVIRVRGGRLIAAVPEALAGAAVLLGDTVPNRVSVKAMGVKRLSNTNEAISFSSEEGGANNVMTFVNAAKINDTIDGQTIEIGDLVLLNAPYCTTYTNPPIVPNGIWERIADDEDGHRRWKRVSWLDDAEDFRAAYGLRIDVEQGDLFAGRCVYFANREDMATADFNFGSDRLGFHDEVDPQPSCALLTEAPMTVVNEITVTDNRSTGETVIGTLAAGTTTFLNPIHLERDVTVTAPAGGKVVFLSGFSGEGRVTFDGDGEFEVAVPFGDTRAYRTLGGKVLLSSDPTLGALFHLDATKRETMTLVPDTFAGETVTNVMEWTDVRGADPFGKAVARAHYGPGYTDTTYWGITRDPVLHEVEVSGGVRVPVVDMHDLFVRGADAAVTNSAAMDFTWANGTAVASYNETKDSVFKHIRQAYVVVKDNVDEGATYGMSFLGTTTSRNLEHYMRGEKGKMIAPVKGNAITENVIGGTNELDGVVIDDVTAKVYPAGLHLISFAPTGDTWVASLGIYGNYRRGALSYSEVILFTNGVTALEHQFITKRLMDKWLNTTTPTPIVVTNEVALLSISGGTTSFDNYDAVKAAALESSGSGTLDASLVLGEQVTYDVTFTDATTCGCVTVDGVLTLPEKATVRVHMPAGAKTPAGAYRILAADSIVGDVSGWTVTSEGKYPMRVFRNSEGVWVSPEIPGILIMVR